MLTERHPTLELKPRDLACSVMSGMDNVRNITGSPISGIDPHELLDVRPLVHGPHPSCIHMLLCNIAPSPPNPFHPGSKLCLKLPTPLTAPAVLCCRCSPAGRILVTYAPEQNDKNACNKALPCQLLAPVPPTIPWQLRANAYGCAGINAMHTNNGHGNPELSNLPRKLNIGLSNSRDDFPHTHINDVGLKAVQHPDTGEVRKHDTRLSAFPLPTQHSLHSTWQQKTAGIPLDVPMQPALRTPALQSCQLTCVHFSKDAIYHDITSVCCLHTPCSSWLTAWQLERLRQINRLVKYLCSDRNFMAVNIQPESALIWLCWPQCKDTVLNVLFSLLCGRSASIWR